MASCTNKTGYGCWRRVILGSLLLFVMLMIVTFTIAEAHVSSSSTYSERLARHIQNSNPPSDNSYSEQCPPAPCICNMNRVTCIDAGLQDLVLTNTMTMSSTQYYILTGNNFTQLPNDGFSRLVELRSLDLSQNQIVYIETRAFRGLLSMTSLTISNNLLQELQAGVFDYLEQLTELRLDGNRLVSIGEQMFIGQNLRVLNLSNNSLTSVHPEAFGTSSSLTDLDLHDNNMATAYPLPGDGHRLASLRRLDLGANPIMSIDRNQFSGIDDLQEVLLSHMPELVAIDDEAFINLFALHLVNLSFSRQLHHVSPIAFVNCSNVSTLDLSNSRLKTLDGHIIIALPNLKTLKLSNNNWHCDCSLQWLSTVTSLRPQLELPDIQNAKCATPLSLFDRNVNDVNGSCSTAMVVQHSIGASFRLGSTALLECHVSGNPDPSIQWTTPNQDVYTWYPFLHHQHHRQTTTAIVGTPNRIQVLRNGNLFISPVQTIDAGLYVCMADNVLGQQAAQVALTLDFEVLMHVKVVSILVGLATSIAFMLAMLIAQLMHMVVNRWGCCCCCRDSSNSVPPRVRHIRKMLESIEHYKTQQLEWLRENYAMQVQRIKDNCQQQLEWIRESYTLQSDRFRDAMRDYGTQQLGSMVRDQYSEQVRRVRDYSTQQMNRVRENYVFQRNRVRKFSAHQLFKLRENYKVQQMHLNKILENLNLESCRTVCSRTDSIMFNLETTGTGSVISTSYDDGVTTSTASVNKMLQPFHIEMTDILAIDALPNLEEEEEDEISLSDNGDNSLPTPAFVTPLQSPLGSPVASCEPPMDNISAEINLDQVVTCIINPGNSKAKKCHSVVNV